jgi:hypothetical protein
MDRRKLTENDANRIYDIFVKFTGVSEFGRDEFIYHHCFDFFICTEWKVGGIFGEDVKYIVDKNQIVVIKPLSGEKEMLVKKINSLLKKSKKTPYALRKKRILRKKRENRLR